MFSQLYLRSLLSKIDAVVVDATGVLATSGTTDGVANVDSNGSALRFRLKLDSVENNDEVFVLNDESNVLLVVVGTLTVENIDDVDFNGVLKVNGEDDSLGAVLSENDEVDGLETLLNNVDDVDNDGDDVKRLVGLLVVPPDRRELVVFSDDENERLDPCNKELLVGNDVVFVDRSEFVVDNNEDAVDGFF